MWEGGRQQRRRTTLRERRDGWGRGRGRAPAVRPRGPSFSPGSHSACLTGVQVSDIPGRVNQELELGQH